MYLIPLLFPGEGGGELHGRAAGVKDPHRSLNPRKYPLLGIAAPHK